MSMSTMPCSSNAPETRPAKSLSIQYSYLSSVFSCTDSACGMRKCLSTTALACPFLSRARKAMLCRPGARLEKSMSMSTTPCSSNGPDTRPAKSLSIQYSYLSSVFSCTDSACGMRKCLITTALHRPSSVPARIARRCRPGERLDRSNWVFQEPSVRSVMVCRLSNRWSSQYSYFVTGSLAVARMQQSNASKDSPMCFVLFIVCLC